MTDISRPTGPGTIRDEIQDKGSSTLFLTPAFFEHADEDIIAWTEELVEDMVDKLHSFYKKLPLNKFVLLKKVTGVASSGDQARRDCRRGEQSCKIFEGIKSRLEVNLRSRGVSLEVTDKMELAPAEGTDLVILTVNTADIRAGSPSNVFEFYVKRVAKPAQLRIPSGPREPEVEPEVEPDPAKTRSGIVGKLAKLLGRDEGGN